MHVFDELLLVIAFVDGVNDVMELLLFDCGEDHAIAWVILGRISGGCDSTTLGSKIKTP